MEGMYDGKRMVKDEEAVHEIRRVMLRDGGNVVLENGGRQKWSTGG